VDNRITVTLSRELHREITRLAQREHRSKSNLVQLLLIEALKTRRTPLSQDKGQEAETG